MGKKKHLSHDPEGKDVLAAFEEMQQAMIDKDIEKMRGLTSPDKTFTHMSGNIAIPGSSNEDHILENFSIFDFELTEEEMNRLRALEKDERFSTY